MANSFVQGVERRKKKVLRGFVRILVIYVIVLVTLLLVGAVSSLFSSDAERFFSTCIYWIFELPISLLSRFHWYLLGYDWYLRLEASLPLIAGSIVFLIFLFRLVVRGLWRFIFRPWVLVTAAFGLFVTYYVNARWGQGIATTLPFGFIRRMLLDPYLAAAALVSGWRPEWGELMRTEGYGLMVDLVPAYTYFVVLWCVMKFSVWFSLTWKFDELGDSHALELCNEVHAASRKATHRTPHSMIFYIDVSDDSINACAFDRNRVCITRGLAECGDDEVFKAILAHEMGHIVNYDVTAGNIARWNVNLCLFIIMIPTWFLLGMASPTKSERRDGVTPGTMVFYLVCLVLGLFGLIVQAIVRFVHYLFYLAGGKMEEYRADRYSVKLGYGIGLIAFFKANEDMPSGGWRDPHPSVRNRIDHLKREILGRRKRKEYSGIDIDSLMAL